jgi:hypothetical protein
LRRLKRQSLTLGRSTNSAVVSEDSFFRHWPNRALGIGKNYKDIFAQIMNNFYSFLLLSSSLFLRVLRAFAVRKKNQSAKHKKIL